MKSKRIISALLTFVMLLSFVPAFNLTAFAENDNIELTVNIQPLKISKSITISAAATYKSLKEKIEDELNVSFENDGYEIYCPEARIYYHPTYAETLNKKVDETKTLKELNFKTGYTVSLEKLPWLGTEEKPIEVFGLKIWGQMDGIKGSCEPFCQGNSDKIDFSWNYSTKVITIQTPTPITISGVAEDGVHIIIRSTGTSEWANLTINNVSMSVEKSACITLNTDAQLNLTLEGANTLISRPGFQYGITYNAPAIELNQSNSYLKINGNGKLTAVSTCEGYPGIGTESDDTNVKGVEINGGTIISTGGTGGAGILAKRIWIYGGNVTANGGLSAKSAFKIENATVTANSDTKVFSGTLKPTLNGQNAEASVNKDGSESEKYDASKSDTYKYFKTVPKTEVSLTVDETQEYTYDGTAKAFKIPNDTLDGFSVAYKQGESDVPSPTNAGNYDVVITRAEDDTYKSYSKTIENGLVIKPKMINTAITLTAPVKNATPQTSIETDEYTASVEWTPEIAEGGTFAKSTEYTAKITITLKDTTNYTFDGIAENGYTLDGATSVTNVADSDTVTAVFPKTAGSSGGGGSSVTRYTVKFDTDGGSTVANQTVTKNSKATEPTKPTKEGYIFDGWYTDSKFANEYYFDTKVTKNITLYAKWVEDEVQNPSDDKNDDTNDKKDDNKPTPNEWKNPFDDVKENEWYFDDVKYANENGLMTGITNSTFAPNENITRGMFVTVLYRAEDEPTVNKSIPFADVKANMYYANAVIWAEQNDIVEGYSETEFAPDENITREQIAAILYRYAKFKGYDVTQGGMQIREYEDFESISDYAINAMTWAVNTGLMKGKTETTLNPKDNATRAEIAAILNRFIETNK